MVAVLFVSCFGLPCFAGCPSADLTGDCRVDFNDFAVFAEQWLTDGVPYPILNGMTWVSIDDPGIGGDHEGFNGQMSKYETTNAQYCEFLNAADVNVYTNIDNYNQVYATSDYSHSQPYYNLDGPGENYDLAEYGGKARINYSGGSFTVDSGFENHPVTYVSCYGATAFCNYYGYRLPTEWEWQAVADYDGTYIYGCGVNINNTIANYYGSDHPDGTTIVGSMGDSLGYGYGMCDMAGNVFEWTSTSDSPPYESQRVLCGGSWMDNRDHCKVSYVRSIIPWSWGCFTGFRACKSN
jgi:formylglycine-generating enzyme required for sulfatase activity